MICQLIFLKADRFECFLQWASFCTGKGHEGSKHTLNIPVQISVQLDKLNCNNSAVALEGTSEGIKSKILFSKNDNIMHLFISQSVI